MITAFLDLLFPPRCYACMGIIHSHSALCAPCHEKIEWLHAHNDLCQCCGFPLPGNAARCASCTINPPFYQQARACFAYTEHSKMLILRYKYYNHTQSSRYLGGLLHHAGQSLLKDADYLVPVPLHWRRLLRRGYNQSALLAHSLSTLCGIPVLPALIRHKGGHMQASLPRHKRLTQVKSSFKVSPAHSQRLCGTRVVLIDDVITTGATVEACGKALLKSGVGAVSVLALARTIQA